MMRRVGRKRRLGKGITDRSIALVSRRMGRCTLLALKMVSLLLPTIERSILS